MYATKTGEWDGRRGRTVPAGAAVTPPESETLVLVVATTLAAAVIVEGKKGSLPSRVGVLLLTVAMLAAVAALLHMAARW